MFVHYEQNDRAKTFNSVHHKGVSKAAKGLSKCHYSPQWQKWTLASTLSMCKKSRDSWCLHWQFFSLACRFRSASLRRWPFIWQWRRVIMKLCQPSLTGYPFSPTSSFHNLTLSNCACAIGHQHHSCLFFSQQGLGKSPGFEWSDYPPTLSYLG